jgi:ankyrin repeat protein
MRPSFLLLAALLLAAWGCGGDSQDKPTGPGGSEEPVPVKVRTPEEARRELGALAIQYTEEAFTSSIENNDTLVVKLFIEAGMDPNTALFDEDDYVHEPMLNWAVRNGHAGVAQVLLAKGADVNAKDGDGRTALMQAAREGDIEIARILLAAGADVNAQDRRGQTALVMTFLEAWWGDEASPEMGRFLLDAVVAEADTAVGTTYVLKLAAFFDYTELVQKSLRADADINAASDFVGTALMYATTGFGRLETVNVLLAAGADVNAQNNGGQTALLYAVEDYRRIKIVEALIKAGADVNAGADGVGTALMRAASTGYLEIADLLLKAGADVNVQDQSGWTALMKAAMAAEYVKEETRIKMVQLLLGAGADINAQNNLGETALYLAWKYPVIVQLLKDAGALDLPRTG